MVFARTRPQQTCCVRPAFGPGYILTGSLNAYTCDDGNDNKRAVFYGANFIAARRDWRRDCKHAFDMEGGCSSTRGRPRCDTASHSALLLKADYIVKMRLVCPI